ncbi:MAG TPA: hypothetical protein VM536_05595, partial [Chloroflexia bacterium]|nr:hypothetical protein [Chloroflexia bacterium]
MLKSRLMTGHPAASPPAEASSAHPPASSSASRPAWPLWLGRRRILAIPALALAGWAESLIAAARPPAGTAPPSLAWILFALAGALFALAAWPVPARPPAAPSRFMAALRGMPRRLVFLGLLVAAALAAGGALPLFVSLNTAAQPTEPANTGAWLLWIAALLLFGAAWAVWESSTLPPAAATPADPSADRLPRGYEWLLLAALFALGLLLRLPNLQSVPP